MNKKSIKISMEKAKEITENWLTIKQLSEKYNLATQTIRQKMHRESIPHALIGNRSYTHPKVADMYFNNLNGGKLINYEEEEV